MELPQCAMVGRRGTVIVRMMDSCDSCERNIRCQWSECSQWSGSQARTESKCSVCLRTSYGYPASDCDSVKDRFRYFNSRPTRRRYVNVWAAVCLFLVVSEHQPALAAPLPFRRMDIDWDNPCSYNLSIYKKPEYSKKLVNRVHTDARILFRNMEPYLQLFASQVSDVTSFDDLYEMWRGQEWFRETTGFREEMLPKDKTYNNTLPEEILRKVTDEDSLDDILPHLYRGLKIIGPSFEGMYKSFRGMNRYAVLASHMGQTSKDIRTLMCSLFDLLMSKDLMDNMSPINHDDVLEFSSSTSKSQRDLEAMLLFRDTLSYANYLQQVFEVLAAPEDAPATPT